MQRDSKAFTLLFAAAVCGVCSVFVAGSAISLRDRQEANAILDRQKKVLSVAGLLPEGATPEAIGMLFEQRIQPVLVELESGEEIALCAPGAEAGGDCVDAATYDQVAETRNPAMSSEAPSNKAQVPRIPHRAMLYHVVGEGDPSAVSSVILPVEGKGLWSTMYGFLALDAADVNTVQGLVFYKHGETPGLGGEVDNPSWLAKWPGQLLFDDARENVVLEVAKNARGPHQVDALSGATITSNGVTYLLDLWAGGDVDGDGQADNFGFGPYLSRFRAARGAE